MNKEQVFERLKRSKGVPSLPQVLKEVVELGQKKTSSSKDLANVIKKDPSLTTQLLRLVNSPLHRRTGKISSINYAVSQLGFRSAMALALSTEFYRTLKRENIILNHILFWRHSLETAIACREIAKACGYNNAEEAFILGLIHDIGILSVESEFPKEFRAIWKKVQSGAALIEAEESTLGTNHAKIGKFLADDWNLPHFMGKAIAQHHDDPEMKNPLKTRLGIITNLGNKISKFRILHPSLPDEIAKRKIEQLGQSLGFESSFLSVLQSKTLEMLIEESKFLKYEIGMVEDLLRDANTLIYQQYTQAENKLQEIRKNQEVMAKEKVKEAALNSLKTINATFSHHINNSTTQLMGGAERVTLAIQKGKIIDHENIASDYLEKVFTSVDTITDFLVKIKKLSHFDTTKYTDETSILDIGNKLKEEINDEFKDS